MKSKVWHGKGQAWITLDEVTLKISLNDLWYLAKLWGKCVPLFGPDNKENKKYGQGMVY